MAGSWIVFETPDGGKLLLCEESGVAVWPSGSDPEVCDLRLPGRGVAAVCGNIDNFALVLGARSVP